VHTDFITQIINTDIGTTNIAHHFAFLNTINFKHIFNKALNINVKYSTRQLSKTSGIYIMMAVKVLENPISIFLFYSTSKHRFLNFKFYKGYSYYKGFTAFII
jgi:hypothetical protein